MQCSLEAKFAGCQVTRPADVRSTKVIEYEFGVCPKCLRNDGFLNIERDHWYHCRTHKLKWWVGSNLFSEWTFQDESTWRANAEFLASYTEIKEFHPGRLIGLRDPATQLKQLEQTTPEVNNMGMDLSNQHGQSFRFTIFSWENMLNLAMAHGWEPQGTQPWEPEDEDDCSWSGGGGWDGSYATNDGQLVAASDSRNLAGALEKAQPKKFAEFVHFCRQGEFRIF